MVAEQPLDELWSSEDETSVNPTSFGGDDFGRVSDTTESTGVGGDDSTSPDGSAMFPEGDPVDIILQNSLKSQNSAASKSR